MLSIIIGTVAGLIAIYKYIIKRPDVIFDAYAFGDLDHEDQAPVVFYVKNRGRRFAEDVFISLRLHDWILKTSSDEVAEAVFPSEVGYSWMTSNYPEEVIKNVGYEHHRIHLENPVYENVELEVTTKIIKFDRGERHHLDYLVACRSHRPRGGTITFLVHEDGSIDVESEHSTFWKRIKNRQL